MGQVVRMFADEAPVAPGTTKIAMYCVQPYWRDRFELVAGRRRDFRSRREAMVAAKAMAARYAATSVFMVTGDPQVDEWSRPEFLATFGEGAEPV